LKLGERILFFYFSLSYGHELNVIGMLGPPSGPFLAIAEKLLERLELNVNRISGGSFEMVFGGERRVINKLIARAGVLSSTKG